MSKFNKKQAVLLIQKHLGLKQDGVDGPITWAAIHSALNIVDTGETVSPELQYGISKKSYDLIIKHEVGGGENYYNKALSRPSYPGGASGVTIGIGYDLGYVNIQQFTKDWKQHLSQSDFTALALTIGKKRDSAKAEIIHLRNIKIPWAAAQTVFGQNTLPKFIAETQRAFPGSNYLLPDAFGALVSLVFNRGGSMVGASRTEMNNIRRAIIGEIPTSNIYNYISSQISIMKRIWVGKNLDGLLARRDDEAALVKSCA
jgi:GH24 family phage-related lysozyme (muramidase)